MDAFAKIQGVRPRPHKQGQKSQESRSLQQQPPSHSEFVPRAGQPSGRRQWALDGWMFSLEVTNSGDQVIETLEFEIEFLDIDGNVIKSDDTTVVEISEFKGREWLFESELANQTAPTKASV